MKKLVAILALVSVAQGAFAYIKEGTTSDIKSLQGSGYSQACLQIVDSEIARQQREGEQYVQYYNNEFYNQAGKSGIGKWYYKTKLYFDPIQDDGLFGNHENAFTNTWFPDQPKLQKVDSL